MRKPIVALVGRPNTGKSTLFNRLIGERRAVTSDIPGTTRDRIFGEADWNGLSFLVVDTGGLEIYEKRIERDSTPLAEGSANFIPEIRAQAMAAISEADLVLFLVDADAGITSTDEAIGDILRRSAKTKPIIIVANKADNQTRTFEAVEFYSLGLSDQVMPISALHGTGTGDLLDEVVKELRNAPPEDLEAEDESLKIAIIGRPNVGKSSLLNKLLGEERAIVSPVAGTTRDAIDTHLTWEGMPVTLVDTAGIRRPGAVVPGIEQFSVLRAYKALEKADVALLVLDGTDGITAQDTHIGGLIQESYRSVVIIVNKWDIVEKDEHTMVDFEAQVRSRFDFLRYAPVLFISAKTGQRIHTVLPTAARVQEERLLRIQTSKLNKLVRAMLYKHTPIMAGGRQLKIYHATQVKVDPPTFLFHVNDVKLVHFSYARFIENQLRAEYGFVGTPIRLSFRPRSRKDLTEK